MKKLIRKSKSFVANYSSKVEDGCCVCGKPIHKGDKLVVLYWNREKHGRAPIHERCS